MLITIENPGLFFCFDLLRYNLDISSTGTGSEALKLLWRKLKDVTILQLRRIHLVIILTTIENPDIIVIVLMAVIQLELSGAFSLLRRKLGDVSLLQLNLKHGSSFVKDSFNDNANFDKEHGVVLEAVVQLEAFLLGGIHLVIMLITIKNLGCYSTGTESKALMFFWKKSGGYYTIGTKTGERGDSFEMKYRL
uniref:Transmembrane protein n=1 Tax=Strongyloides stercoralis TaxID=6248 RepID=A0A0K0E4Y5_STRER